MQPADNNNNKKKLNINVNKFNNIIKQQQEEIIHMRKIINILQEDPFETESKINFEPSLNVLIQNKSKALVIKAPPIK